MNVCVYTHTQIQYIIDVYCVCVYVYVYITYHIDVWVCLSICQFEVHLNTQEVIELRYFQANEIDLLYKVKTLTDAKTF